MKPFKYGDEKISEKEIMIAVPSIVIGGGVLTLPRHLAEATIGSDGWIVLAIVGLIFVFFTWIAAKLASRFPHQTFHTYASLIVSTPIATALTILYGVIFLLISSYVVRNVSDISKEYLLNETPVEVISLVFLLVVIYAVSGARVGLFRLNTLFLPIILAVASIILLFNLKTFEFNNLLPTFETSFTGYVKGAHSSITSYVGFGIVLFYIAYVKNPQKAPKAAVIGMCIPIALYILTFIISIGVFGQLATANLLHPVIELAKRMELPGMVLERFESLFFVVWLMAIFTTAAMTLDIAVLAINSVLKKTAKIKIILILAPIYYYISMFPKNFNQVDMLGNVTSSILVIFSVVVTSTLLVAAKIKGVKGRE